MSSAPNWPKLREKASRLSPARQAWVVRFILLLLEFAEWEKAQGQEAQA